MDPAPGPANGALALAALCTDAFMSRALSYGAMEDEDPENLRSTSKDLRDAHARTVEGLELRCDTENHATTLPTLCSLVASGMRLEWLDLQAMEEGQGDCADMPRALL